MRRELSSSLHRLLFPIAFLLSVFGLINPPPVFGDPVANAWIKPTSGYWEEQSAWSLGALPNSSQSVYITNSGWKAVAIGANAAQNFPGSMQIQGLVISSPVDSRNVFLMNFSGFEVPLQTTSLTIGSNSSVIVQSSMLEVSNTDTNGSTVSVGVAGTFNQGDYAQVKVHGGMQISRFDGSGAYYLTNGTLSVDGMITMGGFAPGEFIQYGGENDAGSIWINSAPGVNSDYTINDGEINATNGITVGLGDYATSAAFYQGGGTVKASTVVNGHYFLGGGTLTGFMSVAASSQRVNGSVLQTGGTNIASGMELGHPNRFGGGATYVLSNGVIQVESSSIFRGGWFTQYAGLHTIVSNFVVQGTFVGPGNAYAEYTLEGGTLAIGGTLSAQTTHFTQNGGTNSIAGDLVVGSTAAPSPWEAGAARYVLSGGLLSARNVTVNVSNYAGFRQTGGVSQISGQLTVQGITNGTLEDYTLEGGSLAVKDIYVGNGAFFQHTGGNISQSGLLTLSQGEWRAATNDSLLGPLKLAGGQNSNSSISFPNGSSILRLANSSAQPWAAGAILYVTNWHGSTSGGGATQLRFGSNSTGLTAQQLAKIRFNISGSLYSATILPTGEVVPMTPPQVQFSRNGNTMSLSWGPGWFLQSATNVAGPYQDVPGATSPYPINMTKPREYFRLRQ